MSSGLQNLLTEIIKWTGLAVIFGLFVANFESLKAGFADIAGIEQATSKSDPSNDSSVRARTASPDAATNGNWIQRTNRDNRANGLPPARSGAEGLDNDRNYLQQSSVSRGPTVALTADRGGHFYTPVRLNGREIEVVVDTGATLVAMSYDDARAAGIFVRPSDFKWRSRTANGIAKSARVMIDKVDLGGITVRNVQASVAEPGRLHITLLGMSFLSKLQRFEMSGGKLILQN